MAKKGRNKRGKRSKRSRRSGAAAKQSNVIQFPAVQAAAQEEAEAQVAIGGDISSDSMQRPEEAKTREDETGSHRRPEEESDESTSQTSTDAKSSDAKSSDEKSSDEKSSDEKSSDEKSSDEKPAAKKGKKKRTTSSAVIRALTQTGEHAQVTEDFFSAETYEAAHEGPHETWEDLRVSAVPLEADAKRHRTVTFVIGGILTALIGGMVVYYYWMMPRPEELASGRVTLPDLNGVSMGEGATPEPPPLPPVPAADPPPAVDLVPDAVDLVPDAVDLVPDQGAPEEGTEVANGPEGATPEVAPEVAPEALPDEVAAPEAPPEAAAPTGDYATLLEEATGLERRHRRRQAMEAYRNAIEANPNGAEALANLAFMLLNRSQNREALELAERATTVDPTNSKAWITLGAARQATGNAAGGREAYQQCVDQGQGRYVRDCRAMLR